MTIKIPNENKRFSQMNNSDLSGNIWYTKNINFDDEGYIKLSSRSVQLISEENDSNLDVPLAFGRLSSSYFLVSADKAYDLSLTGTAFSATQDAGSNTPTASFDGAGLWFQNRWHATTDTGLFYKTTVGGNWTDTSYALTSGKMHPMAVFKNRNTLCIGNGNVVKQINTSYAAGTNSDLTIPSEYEVSGLAYSNYRLGVITRLADTIAGQNVESFLFLWDGGTTEASGGFPVGSDTVESIVAYKSSFVILTRTGELKYFNGGGFETLATLPFFYKNITWGDATNKNTLGANMVVDGDIIYINISNDINVFGKTKERYLQNYPAGVLCYDPKVGVYHRYSPSLSPASLVTVAQAGVNTTTNILTAQSGTLYATGTPIKYTDSDTDLIGGLMTGRIYYIIKHTSTTFSLAETYADALAGNKVDLTAQSGTFSYFLNINILDYGASYNSRTGAIVQVDTYQETADHLLFGADMTDANSATEYSTLCVTVPDFENRGYFVTPRIEAQSIEDNTQKVFLKYSPLDINDKIIVKYKDEDILDIPVTTISRGDQSINICTWTDENTMTTTYDLSAIKSYLDADTTRQAEVEIISGNGAGAMAQISSLTESGGTYTINLAEDIQGATAGYKCGIIIDNWKLLKTKDEESSLDSTNTLGWAEYPVNTKSKWIKVKVELRGSNVTVEEVQVVNKTQQIAQ